MYASALPLSYALLAITGLHHYNIFEKIGSVKHGWGGKNLQQWVA
jgi:hypothetical protein